MAEINTEWRNGWKGSIDKNLTEGLNRFSYFWTVGSLRINSDVWVPPSY